MALRTKKEQNFPSPAPLATLGPMTHATPLSLSARAMDALPQPWLQGLNAPQRAAVTAPDGPMLLLAGAGTGKTRALTARIAHILRTGRARPGEILAVTFTNKAAREMRSRIGAMVGETVEGMPWLGTFHAICVKLLRRHAELVGLTPSFGILDTDDQLRLMRQLLQAENIDEKRWPARLLAAIIDGWKNRAYTPEAVPASEASAFDGRGPAFYAAYQARLKTLNAVDFGDLLLHVLTIFRTHPDVLATWRGRFRHILVDEYQDTNTAQYLWLRLLAQEHRNICCVGDDDQSIYGWRGAEVGNILRFEKDFPGAQVIRLEQNYRSTPHILAAASAVIAANRERLGKKLWTEAAEGEKVRLIGHWDGDEEARWIGDEIEDHASGRSEQAKRRKNVRSSTAQQERERQAKGGVVSENPDGDIHLQNLTRAESLTREGQGNHPVPKRFGLDEIVILVRASHQMRAFEDRFLTIGLPYRVIGGPRFYERAEIRDAMAYFRLAVSPADDLAFERVVNTPKRGLGEKAQQAIQRAARDAGVPLVEGARRLLAAEGLSGKGARELRLLLEGIARWATAVRVGGEGPDGRGHIALAETILEESGYIEMWQNDKTPEAPGRLENLKELIKALEGFENLQGFLDHVALIMDNEQEEGGAKVTIMTLHAAKGLEFPVVFLPGWEDGLFPSQRSMDESGQRGLEEERRLAHVGITRAEEICTISFAANRRVYGQWQSQLPSRFIDELPPEHVQVLTPPGLYGGGLGAAHGGGPRGFAVPEAELAGGIAAKAATADVYASPGWRRLQARQAERPLARPADAAVPAVSAAAVAAHGVGARVFHQKFGYGTVTATEGDKLDIAFDKAGSKKVVGRFVVPAERADDVPF